MESAAMRVLMVTSFPIPGEYDGTAMLPIKVLRALRPRGVDVVVAYLRARPPWQTSMRRTEFEGAPVYEVPAWAWSAGGWTRRTGSRRCRCPWVRAPPMRRSSASMAASRMPRAVSR